MWRIGHHSSTSRGAKLTVGEWGRHSSTFLQGAKINDSLGPPVCDVLDTPLISLPTFYQSGVLGFFGDENNCNSSGSYVIYIFCVLRLMMNTDKKLYGMRGACKILFAVISGCRQVPKYPQFELHG